ncbi:hypothetical protein B4135_4131 [Caldibacillus debilis]|uniref:Uncharacterized protein n=1 Tax=Caldibacillus debilis TaxID=301148 RepID=A0A150L7Z7_9BACI|nr:hypothetical protein B4135_4131 [Caldibacillus debilis]
MPPTNPGGDGAAPFVWPPTGRRTGFPFRRTIPAAAPLPYYSNNLKE